MMERNDQQEIRWQRRQQLLAAGIDLYPPRTAISTSIKALRDGWQLDQTVTIGGRIRAMRLQGGSAFLDLEDGTGTMQLFFQKKALGEQFTALTKDLDLGDIIEAHGLTFVTKAGEPSVNVDNVRWLAKSLRPLPSSWHGLEDIEVRYRYRELDLLANPEVKQVFIIRGKILNTVRMFLVDQGFLEVETPMLHPIAGGATAKPFTTHHNALDMELYLRVAPELYLKRLIVGGLGRVFEIGRNFRNEGIDRDHNPEFTMMECYASFTDFNWMMNLTEDLLIAVATAVHGKPEITIGDATYPLTKPFPRMKYREAIEHMTKIDIDALDDTALIAAARKIKTDIPDGMTRPKVIDEIFKTHCRPHFSGPTFVYEYPLELSPLAKKVPGNLRYTERFQLLIGGTELGNAFSELNDPVDQRQRFEAQERLRAEGDDEAQPIDETYIQSLEYGMPPTSGLGIGIDRLTAIFTNQKTLKDVILFPTLKPERHDA